MTDEKLTPERAVRLLRAKAGELEHRVLVEAETLDEPMTALGLNMLVNGMMADTALIATLLADFMEHTEEAIAQAAKTATNKPSWRQRSDFGVVPNDRNNKGETP